MIAFDLDDVVVNTDGYFREQIINKYAYDISGRLSHIVKVPTLTDEENTKLTEKLYDEAFVRARPNKDAIETLKKIADLFSRPIKFVTARHLGPTTKKDTKDWLNRYIKGSFDYSISYSNGKSKVPYISDDIRYFVEDVHYYINEISRKVDTVFVYEQSWNKNYSFRKNVIRIKNFPALYQHLKLVKRFE